jgi:hypothetical protein
MTVETLCLSVYWQFGNAHCRQTGYNVIYRIEGRTQGHVGTIFYLLALIVKARFVTLIDS